MSTNRFNCLIYINNEVIYINNKVILHINCFICIINNVINIKISSFTCIINEPSTLTTLTSALCIAPYEDRTGNFTSTSIHFSKALFFHSLICHRSWLVIFSSDTSQIDHDLLFQIISCESIYQHKESFKKITPSFAN